MSAEHGSVLRGVKKSQRAGVTKNYPQLLNAQDQKDFQRQRRVTRTRHRRRIAACEHHTGSPPAGGWFNQITSLETTRKKWCEADDPKVSLKTPLSKMHRSGSLISNLCLY